MKPVTILGAGVAGLAAAYRLKQAGVPYVIYEQASAAGGTLRNFSIDGFRFDHAVHLSFATETAVRSVFDQTDYYTHKPDSRCFDANIWLRHPVQNNLHPLPASEKVSLIKSFIDRPNLKIDSYADWLVSQYGNEIANRYPIRYTKKYWDTNASELGLDWIGNRMHRPTLDQVLFGAMTEDIPNYYYAKEMRYPKEGGYLSFLKPLLDQVDVQTGRLVQQIDLQHKCISFDDGSQVQYHHLINTTPLPIFTQQIDRAPRRITNMAKKLCWTKVHLVSFGFNKPDLVKDLWFYIYDDDIFASRAYAPGLKSSDNCPPGCSSIQFEIYVSSRNEDTFTQSRVVENCRHALNKLKIATQDDILFSDFRTIEYGNIIFYKGMEQHRDAIRDWLGEQDIALAGRYGAWEYLWSNQALISGLNAAEKFV